MPDVLIRLNCLRRPRLLMRAAQIGAAGYRRDRHLARHLDATGLPGSDRVLEHLMDREARMNTLRKTGNAGYSPARHVDLLIAVLGEARNLRAAREGGQVNASGIEAFLSAT